MKQRIAAILQQQRQQRQQRREQQQQWTLEDTKASEMVTARQDLSAFQQRLQGRGGGTALSWWGTSEPEPRPTFAELSKSLPSFEELSRDWKPPAAADAFPRVLHQTWRTHMVPPRLAVFMRSWRERSASGWSFRLHTDEDNAALVQSRYSWLHKSYLMMNAIQRADVARLLYMHAFGGVYADLDVELLAPLDALLNQTATLGASAMLGQEPLPHAVLLERTKHLEGHFEKLPCDLGEGPHIRHHPLRVPQQQVHLYMDAFVSMFQQKHSSVCMYVRVAI
jgi:hypothetical protein